MAKIKKLIPVGFVIKDLGPNQLSYTCITNLNKWLDENYGIDPVLFFEEIAVPCIEPKCARYNIYDTSNYSGTLICTYIDALSNTKNAVTSRKIFYVYDLPSLMKDERFFKLLNDNKILKIFRCQDYFDKIAKLGFKLKPYIVDDFNINQILQVIKEN